MKEEFVCERMIVSCPRTDDAVWDDDDGEECFCKIIGMKLPQPTRFPFYDDLLGRPNTTPGAPQGAQDTSNKNATNTTIAAVTPTSTSRSKILDIISPE